MHEALTPQQQLDYYRHMQNLPLEILDDIGIVEEELTTSIERLQQAEIGTLVQSDTVPEVLSLQEKYDTPYEPRKVITGVARVAMFASSPDVVHGLMQREAVRAMEQGDAMVIDMAAFRHDKERQETDTIYREDGRAYAQDQAETMMYLGRATKIIDALIAGDETLLNELPKRFVDALKVRMEEYENGVSSEEREAMISVACNGLYEKDGKLKDASSEDDEEEQAA